MITRTLHVIETKEADGSLTYVGELHAFNEKEEIVSTVAIDESQFASAFPSEAVESEAPEPAKPKKAKAK